MIDKLVDEYAAAYRLASEAKGGGASRSTTALPIEAGSAFLMTFRRVYHHFQHLGALRQLPASPYSGGYASAARAS